MEDKAALHCMALGGHLVAAGAAGKVLFFDRRSSQQCGSFDDTHAEDVTQVGHIAPAAVHPGALVQCKCTASNPAHLTAGVCFISAVLVLCKRQFFMKAGCPTCAPGCSRFTFTRWTRESSSAAQRTAWCS